MSESWEDFLARKNVLIPTMEGKQTTKKILNLMWDRMYPGFPFHSVNLTKENVPLLSLEETHELVLKMGQTIAQIRDELKAHINKMKIKEI